MAIQLVGILVLAICAQFGSSVPPLKTESPPIGPDSPSFPITRINAAAPRYRLPSNVRPTNYNLEIQPILEEEPEIGTRFTAPGKVNISINCIKDTSVITLHSNTLTIISKTITVFEEGADYLPITSFENSTADETITIRLASPGLRESRKYVIFIEFIALVATDRFDGLYSSSYKDAAGSVRYLAATDFEADDARRAWPCFDEPQMKATWEISILRKTAYHSLSNTVLISSAAVPDMPGWFKDTYNRTEPLPTYLVALAVSDYTNKTADPTLYPGKPVKIWGPKPMMDKGAGNFSADLSAKVLQFFETYFETPSKLLKMDKISLGNDFSAGAMENWGLNTYRESRLLFLDGISTVEDKVRMTTTLSHEIAHQWFGNLVTMKWWNDIWLNEGFATYYAALGVNHVYPSYLALETMVYNTVQHAMQADALDTSRPLSAPAETGPEVDAMFDTLTYYKGASILRMMNAALPEGTLHKGLINYQAKYSLNNTEQDDLFAVLHEQAVADGAFEEGLTIKSVMDTWTLQSGYPVVFLKEDSSSYFLEQEKYVNSAPNPDPEAVKWSIPIAYYQAEEPSNTTTKIWLIDTPVGIPSTAGKWMVVNTAHTGFYRVLYQEDGVNFGLLLDQLRGINFTNIDTQSRSALIDDAINLGAAGYYNRSTSNYLEITRYMNRELSLIPWVTLLTNMARPYRMFARTASFYDFRDYMLALIKNPLTQINMTATPGETADITMLRTRLVEWACNLGDPDCILHAKTEFKKWMDAPANNLIAPDLRSTIYCTAMANGGDAEWDFILNRYAVADVGSPSIYLPDAARISLIKALGCAQQTYRLAKLLDLALDYQSILLPAHRVIAVQAVAGNSAGVELTYNFIRNNYSTLLRRYGVGLISGTLSTLANYMHTFQDLSDLDLFITNHPELPQADTVAKITKNYQWMQLVYPGMEKWMGTATAFPLP